MPGLYYAILYLCRQLKYNETIQYVFKHVGIGLFVFITTYIISSNI